MAKKRKSTSADYSSASDKIIAAAKGGASKQEIREMVLAHNASLRGTKKQGKSKIDVRNMWSYMPKTEKTETKVDKPVVAPPTLQEHRDTFYNNDDFAASGKEGWFKGIKRPSEERDKVISEGVKSGYMNKLQNAVEKKYGKPLHEISSDTDRQMAGDAMIDEEGNILPMSSASGQYSGDNTSSHYGGEPSEKSAFQKKAPRGYKMPGWGKRNNK